MVKKRMKRDSTIRQAMETRNFNFDRNSMEQFRTAITYSIEKITLPKPFLIKTESQETNIGMMKTELLTGKFYQKL